MVGKVYIINVPCSGDQILLMTRDGAGAAGAAAAWGILETAVLRQGVFGLYEGCLVHMLHGMVKDALLLVSLHKLVGA